MPDSHFVELISASNPLLLDDLREKHPAASQLLGTPPTRTLRGDTSETADAARSIADAKRDLLLKGIKPLRKELETVLEAVTKQMEKVKKMKLFGAVVATLSGLIITILEASDLEQDWVKVVSAGFATVGGLVVILSDHFAQAPNGTHITSAEGYGKLDQMKRELSKVENKVQRHALFPLREEDIEEMLSALDEYAAHIYGLRFKTARQDR